MKANSKAAAATTRMTAVLDSNERRTNTDEQAARFPSPLRYFLQHPLTAADSVRDEQRVDRLHVELADRRAGDSAQTERTLIGDEQRRAEVLRERMTGAHRQRAATHADTLLQRDHVDAHALPSGLSGVSER